MPMEEQQLVEIVDHEAESTIIVPEELLQAVGSAPRRPMVKVPPLLRQANNQEGYDPLVVSFGPYHHGKKELQLAEDFKLDILKIFVADRHMDVQLFYTKVYEQINRARSCYIMEFTAAYDDIAFAKMMLLDACFIINYISIILGERSPSTTVKHLSILAFEMILRDLNLLENQIPFFILKLLIDLRYGEEKGEEMLRKYLNMVIFGRDTHRSLPKNDSEWQPLHLLEAYWLVLVSKRDEVEPTSSRPNNKRDQVPERYFYSFRSVSDLMAKGIKFRRSNDDSARGFKFKSGYFNAHLDVPLDFPAKLTKVLYLNLVAFEMCGMTAELPVCDYLEFMKSLLDSPMDVKELREKKILFSTLDSDEEVLRLYKDIKFPIDSVRDTFKAVKDEIEEHYNNKAKTWLAELVHTYFQSPWKALALFTGIFLLVLTLLQTLFTIKPRSTK